MTTPDLSRVPRLRLRDGTVVLPALFSGATTTVPGSVPASAPARIQRDGEWYQLAPLQPESCVLYEVIPEHHTPRSRTAPSASLRPPRRHDWAGVHRPDAASNTLTRVFAEMRAR